MIDNVESNFHPDHLADLGKSGLHEPIILEARSESVSPADIPKETGISNQGIKSAYRTPYFDKDGNILFYQYKIFPSIIDNEGREIKYIQPKGTQARPYILPRIWGVKDKPNKPLWLTEGVKKCLKLIQHGESTISFSGVWNFKAGRDSESDGEKDLWGELKKFSWKGRTVYLAFDADLWVNPQVRKALYELSLRLYNEGAIIKIVTWEPTEGKGIDDFLVYHESKGRKAEDVLEALKKDSSSLENFFNSDHTDEILRALAVVDLDFLKYEQLISVISKKLNLKEKSLKTEVSKRKELKLTTDENMVIVHPSCEIGQYFMSLGFRETVILGDHTEDQNLYLVSMGSKYELYHDTITKREAVTLLFDVRERMLININEKWSKSRMLAFIKNPTLPIGLYQEIKQTLKQYIELGSNGHYGLLTSWIMATYFHRCFNAMPFVFFYGKKGCGKTRGLDLLERLSFNACKTKGVSVASLADSIDATRSTFLNDQAESLSNPKNEEILGILADSYTIGGGKRRIVVLSNKNRKVVEFETYSPKAFASIKDIDSDLKDRCVLFPMIRASKEYPYPEAHLPVWGELRDKLYRLLLVRWKDAKEIYQTTGTGVSHRVRELWKPLETMLRLEGVPQEEQKEVMTVFLESMQETQVELSDHENELFETLLRCLEESKQGVFTVEEIANRIEHDGSITDKALQIWVGKTIKQMGIYTCSMGRRNKKRAYSFDYAHVKNIFDRYTMQINGFNGSMVSSQQNQGISGDHCKNTQWYPMVSQWSSDHPKGKDTIAVPLKTIDQKSNGIAESLTGQGKAGDVPLIPLKMTGNEKEISEEILEVEFIEEAKTNV